MRAAEHFTIEGRQAFRDAVLRVLQQSRHAVTLVDRTFEDWPLESAAGEQALHALLRRGAKLRLLVTDADWLARHGSRFARLRREFAAQIECREIPASLRVDESAVVGDRQHLARRSHSDAYQGRGVLASPSEAEPVADRYQAVWDESTPCLAATTLGL